MAIMSSSQFRIIVEPIFANEFDSIYDQRKDEWKRVFDERQGDAHAYHEEPIMYGFGAAPELPEGIPVTYNQGGVLYSSRYLYRVYGLGFAITKVLVEDTQHIKIGSIYSRHLAQSMIETKETVAANILNRAFNASFVGGDGVALCSNAHPAAPGSANQSNILATPAALSHSSVEQMLIQIHNATDWNGKRIGLKAKRLVVPPSLMFQAERILKSTLQSGTANNDTNAVRSMGLLAEDPAVISRLSSTTAWWIQTDAPEGLKHLVRRKMDKSMEGDFETDSMKYKATERYSYGWTDWKGVYGTAGV
jgi:hypothetical protein